MVPASRFRLASSFNCLRWGTVSGEAAVARARRFNADHCGGIWLSQLPICCNKLRSELFRKLANGSAMDMDVSCLSFGVNLIRSGLGDHEKKLRFQPIRANSCPSTRCRDSSSSAGLWACIWIEFYARRSMICCCVESIKLLLREFSTLSQEDFYRPSPRAASIP